VKRIFHEIYRRGAIVRATEPSRSAAADVDREHATGLTFCREPAATQPGSIEDRKCAVGDRRLAARRGRDSRRWPINPAPAIVDQRASIAVEQPGQETKSKG